MSSNNTIQRQKRRQLRISRTSTSKSNDRFAFREPPRPQATTASHFANPDVEERTVWHFANPTFKSDHSFAFREPPRQQRMAMRTAHGSEAGARFATSRIANPFSLDTRSEPMQLHETQGSTRLPRFRDAMQAGKDARDLGGVHFRPYAPRNAMGPRRERDSIHEAESTEYVSRPSRGHRPRCCKSRISVPNASSARQIARACTRGRFACDRTTRSNRPSFLM